MPYKKVPVYFGGGKLSQAYFNNEALETSSDASFKYIRADWDKKPIPGISMKNFLPLNYKATGLYRIY